MAESNALNGWREQQLLQVIYNWKEIFLHIQFYSHVRKASKSKQSKSKFPTYHLKSAFQVLSYKVATRDIVSEPTTCDHRDPGIQPEVFTAFPAEHGFVQTLYKGSGIHSERPLK